MRPFNKSNCRTCTYIRGPASLSRQKNKCQLNQAFRKAVEKGSIVWMSLIFKHLVFLVQPQPSILSFHLENAQDKPHPNKFKNAQVCVNKIFTQFCGSKMCIKKHSFHSNVEELMRIEIVHVKLLHLRKHESWQKKKNWITIKIFSYNFVNNITFQYMTFSCVSAITGKDVVSEIIFTKFVKVG